MIPGHEANIIRLAQRLHPQCGALELDGHADIDQISGDRDMIGTLGTQVLDQALEQGPCR